MMSEFGEKMNQGRTSVDQSIALQDFSSKSNCTTNHTVEKDGDCYGLNACDSPQVPTGMRPCRPPDPGLPASRFVGNAYLLFISYPICAILLQQPNGPRQ